MANPYGALSKNAITFVTNVLMRYILAGIVVYCCWIPIYNYNYWFTWHVVLCTLGLFPLMAEAIILFASDDLWSRQLTRTQKYWIHGVLISFGTILLTAGSIDIMYYTDAGFHFNTMHGLTGLISMILLLLSILLGVFTNYAQAFRKFARPIVLKLTHNIVGIAGYGIGIISLAYAYYTRWFIYYTTKESRIVALIATILVTIWSLHRALISVYNQIKQLRQQD